MKPLSPLLPKNLRPLLVRVLSLFLWIAAFVAVSWALLAVWLSFPIPPLRLPVSLGLGIVAFVAAVRLRHRPFGPILALLACAAPVFLWWPTITPHNDRRWQSDMAETPWAEISGDVVTLNNFRNTERRSLTDFTPRWETRRFQLSSLRHLDFYMVYWGSPHICHTMMTFDFGAEGRVCASIEARRGWDETTYSPLAGIFRHYELLYVLGDERDLVRRRTAPGSEDQTYLFRISAPPEIVRAIFLDYLKSANALHKRAGWYHSLTTNCSTLIRKHVSAIHPATPWDWRIMANGHLDEFLYAEGYIDRTLPLAELKARSLINAAARSADRAPDFSDRIRAGLPGF
jgi:hypothetical protein